MKRVRLRFDESPLAALPELARLRPKLPVFHVEPNLPEAVIDVARTHWERRLASEYVDVMVMRRFHGLLVDHNSPMDLQELALRLAQQKQTHVALCAAVARSLGSPCEIEFDLGDLQQARDSRPIAHQLVELVASVFTVGEVVALALIRHAIQRTPPSHYRDVLKRMAANELIHGRIGVPLLSELRQAAWFTWPGDDLLHFFVLRHVQAMLDRELVPDAELRIAENPLFEAALTLLGVPAPLPYRMTYLAALQSEVPLQMRKFGLEISMLTDVKVAARHE